jgi:hypothetical protein
VNIVNAMFGVMNVVKLSVKFQMMTILFALTVSQTSLNTF